MRAVFFAAALAASLVGCSNSVQSFIVSPQVLATQSNELANVSFALTVQDNRPNNATLIMRDGDSVKSYPATNDVIGQIQVTLTDALKKRGANVAAADTTTVTIQINQLEANAELSIAQHVVHNAVSVTLQIEKNGSSFNKSFNRSGKWSQPLKLDTAMAERELRVLTEQVLNDLMADTTWQNFLRN